ncbi:MAG: hypothetical protein QM628_08735 [Propionicimonas sp.]
MNPTVFAGDVLYFVLEGELILANPQTGEVARASAGSGRLFHRDTWHNGFNPHDNPVRVIEFFSPPPARGTASDYARRQPLPPTVSYADGRWDGQWPEARDEARRVTSFLLADPHDGRLSFRDTRATHLLSTIVDTSFLRVAHGTVQSGHIEDFVCNETDSVIFALSGELWVDVWSDEVGYRATSPLQPGDAMWLPAGVSERLLVRAAGPATYLRGWGDVPEGWTP